MLVMTLHKYSKYRKIWNVLLIYIYSLLRQGEAESATSSVAEDESKTSRAKALLLKKKLEEKDKLIFEKEEVIKVRETQLESKELMLVERDNRVTELAQQLAEKTDEMQKLQSAAGRDGGLGDEQVRNNVFV